MIVKPTCDLNERRQSGDPESCPLFGFVLVRILLLFPGRCLQVLQGSIENVCAVLCVFPRYTLS